MAIHDPDGEGVASGERGEICIRGDCVSLGYHNRDDANADVFKRGWFHSGDEGFALQDEQGREFFFITGRLKELIIRGGVNYSPLEIDEVLNSHPDVRYALAVPFANRYYGDEIAAYVVPRDGVQLNADALLAHCREHLDFAKTPKVVVIGDDVPYTTTGKPKRLELAQRLEEQLRQHRDTQFRKPRS
jgi:long-chain acyl-CoA synthetase